MTDAVVIRGRYAERRFIPEEPLPTVEGPAELIVFPTAEPSHDPDQIARLRARQAGRRGELDRGGCGGLADHLVYDAAAGRRFGQELAADHYSVRHAGKENESDADDRCSAVPS